MSGLDIHVLPTAAPDDTDGLQQLFRDGKTSPEQLVCLLGKTEGNGCVNDFSRGLATMALEREIARHSSYRPEAVSDEVMLIMSGGTEGILTPHVTAFSQRSETGPERPGARLSGEAARTDPFEPAEIGRMEQVKQTARAVRTAMDRAALSDSDDVEFVQIKCPLLTAEDIDRARRNGRTVATDDTYKSMAYSRAASALGVGLATGELSADDITDETICHDFSSYSSVASTSAGVELDHSEILVLGNSPQSNSEYVIGSAVMSDSLDATAVRTALAQTGLSASDPELRSKLQNVFVKAQATGDGRIRGRRHVIHNDSDIPSTRHARSVVNAVVGAVTGDPLSYVSGGAEHQGPDGGGPVAVIAAPE